MRNNMKTTALVLMLCFALALSLTACGDGASGGASGNVSMEGKWAISAMLIEGEDYLAMMTEMLGVQMEDIEGLIFCEFTEGDEVKMVMDGEEGTGTYKLDGNTLTITLDGEELSATVNGNSFTITDDADGMESSMTFTKK